MIRIFVCQLGDKEALLTIFSLGLIINKLITVTLALVTPPTDMRGLFLGCCGTIIFFSLHTRRNASQYPKVLQTLVSSLQSWLILPDANP